MVSNIALAIAESVLFALVKLWRKVSGTVAAQLE